MTSTTSTVRYEVRDHRAYLTLDRPDRLNAITAQMGREIAAGVAAANADDAVRVIILQGAGRAFSAGYDLKLYAEGGEDFQSEVWDPIKDFQMMKANTDNFFSPWRSAKPTIAKVRGYAVAGGSDIALSCDLVVMAEDSDWGESVAAVVQLEPNAEAPTVTQLREFLRARLAPHKTPRSWYVSDTLPANAMGKLQKFRLRDQIQADELQPLAS